MSDDVIIAPAIATTALVPEAHVRMGPTAHEPDARVKINAWGAVTDTVKAAASALPVAQLVKPAAAQPAKPVKQAKPVQRGSFAALIARAESALAAAPAPKAQAAAPVITPKPAQPAKKAKLSILSLPAMPITSGDSPMAAAIKRAFQQMQAEAALAAA